MRLSFGLASFQAVPTPAIASYLGLLSPAFVACSTNASNKYGSEKA